MQAKRNGHKARGLVLLAVAAFLAAGLFGCAKDGDWASHYVYLWDSELDAAYETMAAGTGYVGNDIAQVVRETTYTDFGRLVIAGKTFTFYDLDQSTELATCLFDEKPQPTTKHIFPFRRFELQADQPEACEPYRYFLLTDPGLYPTGEVLIQVRYGENSFEELEEEEFANWWPVLTKFVTTTPASVAAYALELSDFYLSMLPEEQDWPVGAKPADRIYHDVRAPIQHPVYDSQGNLHVIFMPAVYGTPGAKHVLDPLFLGYKVTHAVKDAVTGEWTVEDIVPEPGAGERGAAMAIDASGVIHVVYGYRATTTGKTSLGYLNNAGGSWNAPVWIDGLLSDPGIVNRREDSGDRPKIAVASNGNLMVAYASWKYAMRLATFDAATSQWSLEDVETTDPTYPTPEDMVILGQWSIEFRIDSADRPHIAYRCSDLLIRWDLPYGADGHPRAQIIGMHMRYATKIDGEWVVENVGEAAGWTDQFLVTLGFTLANDEPFIITGYQDVLTGNNMRVKCAKKVGGVWQTDLIYNTRDAYYGWFQIGAATDAAQNVHISFCAKYVGGDKPRHSLMYGKYDGTAWEVETAVDAAQYKIDEFGLKHVVPVSGGSFYMGNSQGIAVDADGNPSIAFMGRFQKGGVAVGGIWEWSK